MNAGMEGKASARTRDRDDGASTQELWTEWTRRGRKDKRRIRDALVERYIPLVRRLAERQNARTPASVDVEAR